MGLSAALPGGGAQVRGSPHPSQQLRQPDNLCDSAHGVRSRMPGRAGSSTIAVDLDVAAQLDEAYRAFRASR